MDYDFFDEEFMEFNADEKPLSLQELVARSIVRKFGQGFVDNDEAQVQESLATMEACKERLLFDQIIAPVLRNYGCFFASHCKFGLDFDYDNLYELAIKRNRLDILSWLIENKVFEIKDLEEMLSTAIEFQSDQIIEFACNHGAKIAEMGPLDFENLRRKNYHIIKLLLEKGMKIDLLKEDCCDNIEYFFDGFDWDSNTFKRNDGKTAHEFFELLRQHGFNINSHVYFNQIFRAIEKEKNDKKDVIIKFLLQQGLNLDCFNRDGFTRLQEVIILSNDLNRNIVARNFLKRYFKLLLQYGANVNKKSLKGHTALYCAADSNDVDACRLCCDYQADLYVRDYRENSLNVPLALDCAIMRNHYMVVDFLYDQGADTDIDIYEAYQDRVSEAMQNLIAVKKLQKRKMLQEQELMGMQDERADRHQENHARYHAVARLQEAKVTHRVYDAYVFVQQAIAASLMIAESKSSSSARRARFE